MRPKTDVRYYRDQALPGIDVCRVVKSRHHFHDDLYIVSMITSGHCYCLGKGRQEEVSEPGTVTLINPGQIHTGAPADGQPLDYALCYFSLKAMAGLASDFMPGGIPEFSTSILKEPVLTAMVRHLLVTMMQSRDSLEKEAVLVSTLHFILSKYGLTGKLSAGDRSLGRHAVTEAKRLLASDLDQKLSLERVAKRVGVSRFHFLRIFKENAGISPHLYRTFKRIELSKKLLSRGMLPAQVAFETGFADQSHFSNTFRRYVGATPRQYLA
ncbi:MAG: AraC family transcriptional regulator [Desulfobacterales bacterium]|nr:AraC family transcriptional regulator [Desulfobacterales bacterium]